MIHIQDGSELILNGLFVVRVGRPIGLIANVYDVQLNTPEQSKQLHAQSQLQ